MKALLIVDVQNDFLPGGALGIPGSDAILPVINALQEQFLCIIATKDWHPSEHMSFAVNRGKNPGETHEQQELWPIHCVQYSKGAELSETLKTDKIERVFLKGIDPEIDSYSTFFDNAHKRSTGLAEYLKKRGVDEIYIVGLATDYCVKYSVLDALELGFKVTVVKDGCVGIDRIEGDSKRALKKMEAHGAHLL